MEVIKEIVPNSEGLTVPSAQKVIFNIIDDNPCKVVNLLFLVAKYHVYSMRCAGKLPNIRLYKQEVYLMRDIEKYNATVNGKLALHMKKWYNIRVNTGVD